jgi:uroporphyrinogen-III synthase
VYRAVPVEDPDLSYADGAVAVIHSPRAARRLFDLVPARKSIAVAAISPAAAAAAGEGWAAVESAAEPTDDALLALAARLCDKPAPE